MPMKKHAGHLGNGGRELQTLLDSGVLQMMDKDDSAGQIPWRTSRRLQEATLRSLTKERDIDNNAMTVKKEKVSSEVIPVRMVKRRRQRSPSSPSSPSSPLDLCLMEELEDMEVSGDVCYSEDKKNVTVNGEISSRKRKGRTVHFADPPFTFIEDNKQEETTNKSVPERRAAQQSRNEGAVLSNSCATIPKQPMSCFDLLCNYAGTKGWRCYRSCVEGESFCNYHLSSRQTAPSVRISMCT